MSGQTVQVSKSFLAFLAEVDVETGRKHDEEFFLRAAGVFANNEVCWLRTFIVRWCMYPLSNADASQSRPHWLQGSSSGAVPRP